MSQVSDQCRATQLPVNILWVRRNVCWTHRGLEKPACHEQSDTAGGSLARYCLSFFFLSPTAVNSFLDPSVWSTSWGLPDNSLQARVYLGAPRVCEVVHNPSHRVFPGLRPGPSHHTCSLPSIQLAVPSIPFAPHKPWSWPTLERVSSFLYKLNVFSTTFPVLLSKTASWKTRQKGHLAAGLCRANCTPTSREGARARCVPPLPEQALKGAPLFLPIPVTLMPQVLPC